MLHTGGVHFGDAGSDLAQTIPEKAHRYETSRQREAVTFNRSPNPSLDSDLEGEEDDSFSVGDMKTMSNRG